MVVGLKRGILAGAAACVLAVPSAWAEKEANTAQPAPAKARKAAKPAARTAAKPATRAAAAKPAAKRTKPTPRPAAAKPTAAKPAKPAAAKPAAAKPAAKPAAAKPVVAKPAAAKPVVARPTAKPAVRPAAAQPAPVRPVARAAANPAARPAVRPAQPAARVVAKPAQPAARSAAKAVQAAARPLAKPALRPVVRTVQAAAAMLALPIQIVTQTNYDMIFRGKKVGEYTRLERQEKDGRIIVDNKSRLTIRMLFAKVTAVNSSHCEYTKAGRLHKFTITSTVRGQTMNYKGTQTDKGITITRWSAKKKSKPKFFAAAQYQGTSLDLRFPRAPSGIQFTRKYLIIPRMRIVSQALHFKGAPAAKVFGKRQNLLEMTIRNRRGSGILLLTGDGRMVASKMRGMLGRVEIRIKKGK